METKYCAKCNEYKSISEFYKNNRGGCKKCIRAYQAKYYASNYATPVKSKLPDGLKRCSKCHEVKPIAEYYKDKSSKSGYQHKCKVCSNIARKRRNQKYLKPKELVPEGFKKCSKCQEVLDTAKFNKVHGKPRSRCKECEIKYRVRNKEQEREYRNKPEIKEKAKAQGREWKKNPIYQAKQKVYRVEYHQRPEVKEKNLKHNRNYLAKTENQVKARANTIAWRKDNPDKANHQQNTKRIRKAQAEGSHTVEQWKLLKSFFDCCPKCGQVARFTRDHIIPLAKGGTDYIDNIQVLCRSCNSSKNDVFAVDYRPQPARYWAWVEMSFVYLA
jgi:hypothetical protein